MNRKQNASVFSRLLDWTLRRRKRCFAPAFYALHRRRISGQLHSSLVVLFVLFVIILPMAVGISWLQQYSVQFSWFIQLFVRSRPLSQWPQERLIYVVAFLLCIFAASVLSSHYLLRARVIPYFERKVGETETWRAGKDLLWNSAALDEIARDLQVKPLSAFASGDPLIAEEYHVLFTVERALRTVEALLDSEEVAALSQGVLSDLTKLRDALTLAEAAGIRFSLHLREGSMTSGHEMDQREGSYF